MRLRQPDPPGRAAGLRAGPWPWPLPALACWLLAALACAALRGAGTGALAAAVGGTLAGALAARWCDRPWRRAIAAGGFPLALLASGLAGPAAWLAMAGVLALAYPLRAWRDAPFFPTPAQALRGLPAAVAAPRVLLDAGCGAGHALAALTRIWPHAALRGIECSAPLAWLARRRCPQAHIVRGDLWQGSWHGVDLVYVFQRPESMPRVWAKARAELAPGAWLASLEFAVPGVAPEACLHDDPARPLWLYRVPGGRPSPAATGVPLAVVA